MAVYYVNKAPQRGGEHEVHREGCVFMPAYREVVGEFLDTASALAEARLSHYTLSKPCVVCCREDNPPIRVYSNS